ncbi:MAG: NAD-dependent epimerase/dehydratase family protein, partial [Candidatus Eisenbacteria bacterium]|nr:NAD-dependent epimerase/dehydratase family protein [Candidatus Eisenbacteria bacterium]
MATYLVTGGAGFIGSHISERLLSDGHEVRILDDFSTGRDSNIDAIRGVGENRLTVIRGDITDAGTVNEAVNGVDGVFHEAALGSVPRSVADPGPTHDVNTTGTLNILVACRDLGVQRVLFAGSSSVFGALAELPKR